MEKWVEKKGAWRLFSACLVFISSSLVLAAAGFAQPSIDMTFDPAAMGPGSTATVVLTITNSEATGVTDLAITNSLPGGLTIADPAGATSTCGGTLSAPGGGTTVTFSGGVIGATQSCAVAFNVTGSAAGVYTNATGDLTSGAGNSGPASADLTIDTNRPGFSKSFSPASVSFGARSTLTFTIDNSANAGQVLNPSFTDELPTNMTVASPPNVTNTCPGGTVGAVSGGTTISYTTAGGPFVTLAAGTTCTISVDVVGGSTGELVNVSASLFALASPTFQNVSCGKATDALTLTPKRLTLVKEFSDDPLLPGESGTVEYTVTNLDRLFSASDLSFTDDFDAALSGLVATSLPSSPCGAGSQVTGSGLVTFSGGSLPAEGSCSFSVGITVPSGAAPGSYPSPTSDISATLDGATVTGGAGSDSLVVSAAPSLTKTFMSSPVGAGGSASMEFTITNTSATATATDIAFSDGLDFLSGVTVSSLPAPGFCGASSTIFQTTIGAEPTLSVSGGSLAPLASCSFIVALDVPENAPSGFFVNTTSAITATIDGETVQGEAASATLEVVGAPSFAKSFLDDPVSAGDTVTVRYTVEHGPEETADATGIAFSDDLEGALAGLVALGLPQSDVCGVGSQITGTGNLSFTGGTLSPGESCSIDVTLQVPPSALPGSYPSPTSNLVATVSGVGVASDTTSDDLQVAGLSFTKSFTDDPVIAGAEVTLDYTIANTSTTLDATGMFFTHNLSAVISGLTPTALPSEPCGVGSQISGTSTLIFTGGNLTAGTSCTFSVTLQVPASADSTSYGSVTSPLAASFDGNGVVVDAASDFLEVSSDLLGFTKEFIDDPVSPGDTVTLEFTVDNLSGEPIESIAFSDDLSAALEGLVSVSGMVNDVCGVGSQISGADILVFIGGSLAPNASCTFSVTLQVPFGVSPGTPVTNVTSEISGAVGGLVIGGPAATAELLLDPLVFTKTFGGLAEATATAGDTVQLTFVIENPSATDTYNLVGFSDDLDAWLPGAVALGLPQSDVCGEGSAVSGTSTVSLTGATVMPGGSCTFNVDVEVPSGAAADTYVNTTTDLVRNGLRVAAPASATLHVEEPVCFVQDNFDDGLVDPAWTLVGVGNANQQSIVEEDGVMKLTADGATAFYGADNAGFLFREVTGDFRMETTIDGNPMTTGGIYRKAGLMVRASLDKWDIRLIAQLVPYWEDTDETHLQFVARESYGSPGRLPVARDVIGVPRVVRLAVERVGQELFVEYSTDDGATWIRPTTGLGGSIVIDLLPETLLVGLDMVSNDISVTSTAHFDDFLICDPTGGSLTGTPPAAPRRWRR